MKKILFGIVFMLFFGSLYAEWDRALWNDKESGNQQPVPDEWSDVQSTARQPGIGDSSHQLEQKTSTADNFEHGDWTDLNNEEMYGAFYFRTSRF